jgi:uncharacterized membrane protein
MLWAMTWYQWFEAAHVLAAVAWVGGGATLTLLAFLTARARDPLEMAHFAKRAAWCGQYLYTPASLIVLGFGFGMIERGHWGFNHFWVLFGLAGWGASFLVGVLFLGPQSARLGKLMGERPPEDPDVQASINRILLIARFDVLLLLLIVFDMAARPFS